MLLSLLNLTMTCPEMNPGTFFSLTGVSLLPDDRFAANIGEAKENKSKIEMARTIIPDTLIPFDFPCITCSLFLQSILKTLAMNTEKLYL